MSNIVISYPFASVFVGTILNRANWHKFNLCLQFWRETMQARFEKVCPYLLGVKCLIIILMFDV